MFDAMMRLWRHEEPICRNREEERAKAPSARPAPQNNSSRCDEDVLLSVDVADYS